MPNNQNNNKKTRIVLVSGLLLFSAVTAGWMLSARPLDNHECFVSVTAREMLDSGNWIMPTCNGQSRLQKTPLSYWLVTGLAAVTGKVDEFTARLPSAVFAFLSACAVLYFVNRWLSLRIALLACAVWATTIAYVMWSHSARPDMAMTFFVALCFLSFYSAITVQSRKGRIWYMVVFWVSFGLGNLAKGPAPIPLVLIPLFFYIAVFRQWRKVPGLLPVIGGIIFLAIVLPWPIAVGQRVNWDLAVWKQNFVDRLFGDYAAGNYPWYYYFPMMFKYTAPWCIFLPVALVAPFYKVWERKQQVMLFLWMWFVADLVFLTISGGKRQNYIIPLIPPMAILTAILINDMVFDRRAFTLEFAKNILRAHVLFFFAAALVLPCYFIIAKPPVSSPESVRLFAITFSVILAAVTITVALLFAIKRPGVACVVLFCGVALLMAQHYTALGGLLSPDHDVKRFALAVAELVPPTDRAAAYKTVNARFVHYFGRTIAEVQTETEADKLYQQDCWIVAFGKELDELLAGNRLQLAYKQENAEHIKRNIVAGGLFHKSPAVIDRADDAGS